MRTKLKSLKNKKWFPIVSIGIVMLVLGMAVASIFYSNRVSQEMELKGIDGYLNLSIETPLPSVVFIGDTIDTSIRVERINSAFEAPWEMVVVFNSSAGDLLASQITGSYQLFEMDHTTLLVELALSPIQNNTQVYCSAFNMGDWSTNILQGDSVYFDLSFVLDNGISNGQITVDIFVVDSLA